MTQLELGICIGLISGMIITFAGIELGKNIRAMIDDMLNPDD